MQFIVGFIFLLIIAIMLYSLGIIIKKENDDVNYIIRTELIAYTNKDLENYIQYFESKYGEISDTYDEYERLKFIACNKMLKERLRNKKYDEF